MCSKTVTLTEGILQLAAAGRKVLACAPTNAAADVLVKRLRTGRLGLTRDQLLRVMAFRVDPSSVAREVVECTLSTPNGRFATPTLAQIKDPKWRVIVGTLASAAKLYNLGTQATDFDVVCVDEAGQATEPMTMGGVAQFLRQAPALILVRHAPRPGPSGHVR